jgi:hypothetical protein
LKPIQYSFITLVATFMKDIGLNNALLIQKTSFIYYYISNIHCIKSSKIKHFQNYLISYVSMSWLHFLNYLLKMEEYLGSLNAFHWLKKYPWIHVAWGVCWGVWYFNDTWQVYNLGLLHCMSRVFYSSWYITKRESNTNYMELKWQASKMVQNRNIDCIITKF